MSEKRYLPEVKSLIGYIPKERRDRESGLLWHLAKHTCRAVNPKCYECLLAHLCEYKRRKKG